MITEKQAIQLGKNIATAINNELHSYYMAQNGATKAAMIASIREHLDFDSFNMLTRILLEPDGRTRTAQYEWNPYND